MKNGLVSVIMPAYNAPDQLKAAIDSVLAQTYPHFEVIVVDDGSTDNTGEMVQSIKDPRIKYIKKENRGNYFARNTGIQAAQGEFIAHLDQDDLWVKDKLEKQVAAFNQDPELGFCCTDHYIFYNEDTDKLYTDNLHTFTEVFLSQKGFIEELLRDNFVILSSVMVKKSCLDQVGVFDTYDNFSMDYELNLRLAFNFKCLYMKDRLVLRRIHAMNLSRKSIEMIESVIYSFNKIQPTLQNNKYYEPKQKELVEAKINQCKYNLGIEYLSKKNYASALKYLKESGRTKDGLPKRIAMFIAGSGMGFLVPLIKLYRTSRKNKFVVPA